MTIAWSPLGDKLCIQLKTPDLEGLINVQNLLIYTIPRRDVTVLGGTAQRGDWDEDIRDEDTELILRKCESLWPELDRSKVVGVSVGLRPSRKEVRLEVENISGRLVVHNYGHGGAGVTLSWGCADEVVRFFLSKMPWWWL